MSNSKVTAVLMTCFLLTAAGCVTITPPSAAPAAAIDPPLPRPVIVIGGFVDPGFTATHVASYVREETGEQRVLAVHPGWLLGFDDAAEMVVDAVEKHFPSDDPDETVEVDVIGISMGGLTARHAGAPYLWTERAGRGRVIAFAGDPNFRDLWHGLLPVFANAVFLGSTF